MYEQSRAFRRICAAILAAILATVAGLTALTLFAGCIRPEFHVHLSETHHHIESPPSDRVSTDTTLVPGQRPKSDADLIIEGLRSGGPSS